MADEVKEFEGILKEHAGDAVVEPFKMPPLEEIFKIIDSMKDMSDEEKEQLKNDLMNPSDIAQRVATAAAASSGMPLQIIFMIVLAVIIFLAFGLVAYKLIQTEKNKISKKEEKRRLKLEKSKKGKGKKK